MILSLMLPICAGAKLGLKLGVGSVVVLMNPQSMLCGTVRLQDKYGSILFWGMSTKNGGNLISKLCFLMWWLFSVRKRVNFLLWLLGGYEKIGMMSSLVRWGLVVNR